VSHLKEVSLNEKTFTPFADARRMFGFVPNFYKAQSLRPDVIETECAFVGSVLEKEGALTRRQKEYIFIVCSAANLSTYCLAAHCEIVRGLGMTDPKVEQIAMDHMKTDLSIPDKVLLTFARKMNDDTFKFGRDDIERLRPYGFGDEAILETMLVVSLAKWANFLSHALGAEPDFDLPKTLVLPQTPAESTKTAT